MILSFQLNQCFSHVKKDLINLIINFTIMLFLLLSNPYKYFLLLKHIRVRPFMATFSNLRIKSSRRSLYAGHSNKKCCSFSIDPVLRTLQIL